MMMRGLMLLLFSTAATASSSRESDQPVRVFILMGQSNMGVSAFWPGRFGRFSDPSGFGYYVCVLSAVSRPFASGLFLLIDTMWYRKQLKPHDTQSNASNPINQRIKQIQRVPG